MFKCLLLPTCFGSVLSFFCVQTNIGLYIKANMYHQFALFVCGCSGSFLQNDIYDKRQLGVNLSLKHVRRY